MSESIDWPKQVQPPRRHNRKFLILALLVVLILFGSRTAVSYWISLLWFQSLGYGSVFVRTLGLQWAIFTAFVATTFLILYGVFALLRWMHRADLPSDHTILFGGRELTLSVKPVLNVIAIAGSLLISLATGGAMTAEWPTLVLFWFAPHSGAGVVDPVFGKPLEFFLFTLPALSLIAGWLLTIAIIACFIAAPLPARQRRVACPR